VLGLVGSVNLDKGTKSRYLNIRSYQYTCPPGSRVFNPKSLIGRSVVWVLVMAVGIYRDLM